MKYIIYFIILAFSQFCYAQNYSNAMLKATYKKDTLKIAELISKGYDVNISESSTIPNSEKYFTSTYSSNSSFKNLILSKPYFELYANDTSIICDSLKALPNEILLQNYNTNFCNIYTNITEVSKHDKVAITPLLVAIELEDTSLVSFLITKGANINESFSCKNISSEPALLYALTNLVYTENYKSRKNITAIINILLAHGAHVNIVGKHAYSTPLHLAIQIGEPELLTKLFKAGASIEFAHKNQPNGSLIDFMFLLFSNTDPECLEILFSRGCMPENPHTFLYALHQSGISSNINLLISKGLNYNTIYQGKQTCFTPLSYALHVGLYKSAELLLQAGATYNNCNAFDNAFSESKWDKTTIVQELARKHAFISDTLQLVKYVIFNNISNADSILRAYNVDTTIVRKIQEAKNAYDREQLKITIQKNLDFKLAQEREKDEKRLAEEKRKQSLGYKIQNTLGYNTWVFSPSILRTHEQTSLEFSFGYQDYYEASGFLNFNDYIKGFYAGCEFQMNKNQALIYVPKIGYHYQGILLGYKTNLLYFMIPNNKTIVFRPEIGFSMVQLYIGFGYNINLSNNTNLGSKAIWTATLNILDKDLKRKKRLHNSNFVF